MASVFLKSAEYIQDYPVSSLPEVGIIGRSNSGKSSLINALTQRKKLAQVSGSPGKTKLLNFYEIDKKYLLVDMPGYGYAARSHDVLKDWKVMIEGYLQSRASLKFVILIVDIDRKWTQDEENLLAWLESRSIEALIVINKVDKLNSKNLTLKKQYFKSVLKGQEVLFASATRGLGIDDLNRTIFEKLKSS